MKVVIVGNGIAGVTAAQELKKNNPDIQVVMFAQEQYPFYSRIKLPEVVSGAITAESTIMYQPTWYEQRGIEVRLGTPVVSIDRDKHEVTLSDDSTCSYDALVLATGSRPNTLQVPGSDLEGLHVLRTWDDAMSLREDLVSPVVVIGGGLLGLEAAVGCRQRLQDDVQVLEFAPYLLSRQLDEPAAHLLADHLKTLGLQIVTNASTVSFNAGDDKRVASITLSDGRTIPARTVLQSLGITPETTLAKACGLAVGKGIVVDDHLRTSDRAIYAIGDCCEFDKRCFGIVPAALEQGQTVGKIIAGVDVTYSATMPSAMLKVAGVEAVSMGKISLSSDEQSSGAWVAKSHCAADRYECFIFQDNVLRGAILYGSKAHMAQVRKMLGQSVDAQTLEQLLGF